MPVLAMAGLGAAIVLAGGCASPIPPSTSTSPNLVSSATFATSGPAVTAAAIAYDKVLPDEGPPMSLTATDGSGLELVRIDARAVVEGPLAFTELHLYFNNPEPRIREGRFSITLPTGAALSRFAMQGADEKMMEAEVVEKMAARRAYEDFLHRRQDPALLEQAAGNEFSARVFPIPANGTKHLVISYSQELDSSADSYVLPLRGLPSIGQLDVRVRVARADRATAAWDQTVLEQKGWKPDRDMVVPITAPIAAVASGDWLAARVAVPVAGAADDKPTSLAILVDTSASRALGFSRQVDNIGELLAAIAKRYGAIDVAVAAFDQDVLPIYRGKAGGWTADHARALLARQPLGASNTGVAMAWAATTQMKRVVVIGDGVVTAGAEDDDLLKQIEALGAKGVERLDTILLGGIRDLDAARTWVAAGLARDGAVIDFDLGAGEAARRLGLPVRSDLAIGVKGASWVWPDRAAGVQPGDEVVVYAKLANPALRAGRSISPLASAAIDVGGTTIAIKPSRVSSPLLVRAAAQADVSRLERDLARATDPKAKTALRDAIIKRSTSGRVISSLTAFLVLETEADYVRFNIPRNALADILVVGDDGVRLEQRTAPVVIAQPADQIARPTTKGGKDKEKAEKSDEPAKKIALEAGAPGVLGGGDDVSTDGRIALGDPAPRDERPDVVAEPPPAAPPPPPEPTSTTDDLARVDRSERGRTTNIRPSESEESDSDGEGGDDDDYKSGPPALTGRLAAIADMIATKRTEAALLDAIAWRREAPGDVLALIALGEALEARGERALAARAYGSLIDLFPGRADLRRFAGERLERLADVGRDLAIDTYRRAVDDRPDHLSGHRLLAMALVRAGQHAKAFAALERGATQQYPGDRFRGGDRILRDDLGLVAAAWLAREPGKRGDVTKRLAKLGAELATRSSLRFVLYWETDANDVDFHIRDARGGHAFYSRKELKSGGELYADVTTGYGPECFTIEGDAKAAPYKLQIHYYSRGPMGYGMGVLEILRHDGKGNLSFEHRPYVAMNDRAYVDLGAVK